MLGPKPSQAIRFDALASQNPRLARALAEAESASHHDQPVCILGEPGSGKWSVACAIHAASNRSDQPLVAAFVEPDCEVPWLEGLLRKAAGGALYLWDLILAPTDVQERLVQVLLRREPVRILTASATDPEALEDVEPLWLREVQALTYQVVVALPPLRDRQEDLQPLLERFLAEATSAIGRPLLQGVSETALAAADAYAWPGNVRELREAAWRAACIARGPLVTAGDLGLDAQHEVPVAPPDASDRETQVLRRHTVHVLRKFGGDVLRAARAMGVSRPTLYRRMKAYQISGEDLRKAEKAS